MSLVAVNLIAWGGPDLWEPDPARHLVGRGSLVRVVALDDGDPIMASVISEWGELHRMRSTDLVFSHSLPTTLPLGRRSTQDRQAVEKLAEAIG